MEVKVRKTEDGYIITEPTGGERFIRPLHYCQMIYGKHGRHYYTRDMPVNYFEKAESLEKAGWYTWYHFDNWVNAHVKNPEHEGYDTDEAIEKIKGQK